MKKILILVMLTLSVSSYANEICATVAEKAIIVASLSKDGASWQQIESATKDSRYTGKSEYRKAVDKVIIETDQDAYYEWSSLDSQYVKQLAYMSCKRKLSRIQ